MAEKCHFAHGQEELRDASQPLPEDQKVFASKAIPTR